jgi:hypothetical protein
MFMLLSAQVKAPQTIPVKLNVDWVHVWHWPSRFAENGAKSLEKDGRGTTHPAARTNLTPYQRRSYLET